MRQETSRDALAALAIGMVASALALAISAGCASGSPSTADAPLPRRAPADTTDDLEPSSPPALWASRGVIEDARLPELRWPDWPELRDAVERFYANRGYTLAWTRKNRPTKTALDTIDLLERAGAHGLAAEDYDAGRWTQRVDDLRDDGATDDDRARFDLALTVCAMRYASDLDHGRIDPRRLGFPLGSPDSAATVFDPAAFLGDLASSSDPEARVAALEPRDPEYRRLIEALAHYRELTQAETAAGSTPLRADDVIRPGDSYADLPRLTEVLIRLGDLRATDAPATTSEPTETAAAPTTYAGEIVEAVERFQRRHGLEPDGKIGEQTLERLSTPLERRVRQIELALEWWRSMPARSESPAIVVNLPEFRLRAFDGSGQVAFETDVVVGRARRHDTPLFSEAMRTVVFRPSWNVPASITAREIVPEIEKDPDHLAKEGYEIVGAQGRDLDAETLADLRSGTLKLRQRPGRGNALGPVKFLFPNKWNVYLHGTPATAGFARARRDLSHGCIRVADPIGLAEWVLQGQPEWSHEAILDTLSGRRNEVAVTLDEPIPVHLVYHTVVASEGGAVLFRDDLYGHDARLERALARRHGEPADAGATAGTAGAITTDERDPRRRG